MKKGKKSQNNERLIMAVLVVFGVMAVVGGYGNYVSTLTGEENVLGVTSKAKATPVPYWPCKVCQWNAKKKCVSKKYSPCDARRKAIGLNGCKVSACGW